MFYAMVWVRSCDLIPRKVKCFLCPIWEYSSIIPLFLCRAYEYAVDVLEKVYAPLFHHSDEVWIKFSTQLTFTCSAVETPEQCVKSARSKHYKDTRRRQWNEICSKLRMKTPGRRQWLWTDFTHCSGVSIVDLERVNAG